MSDFCDAALGFLTDVLEIECPEAATFFKSEKGRHDHFMFVKLHEQSSSDRSDVAYCAAVSALQRAQSDFKEAEVFLNSRIARSTYFDRVGEEARKADFEVEQAKRDEAERRTRLQEKLDRLTRDGILSKEEREELVRSPYFDRLEVELPF
jgi:hypothetical protein